jgi:Uma2 family endonuclease
MTQALTKIVTFDEFIALYPENHGRRYELHNGKIMEIAQPIGRHERIKGFLAAELTLEFTQSDLPYFIPNQTIVKPATKESGYFPDLLIINEPALIDEPLWERYSTVIHGTSIALVIEIVSGNWRDDYCLKLTDYEEMKIPEYWIIDHAALGPSRFIGYPKQPTISIYRLVNHKYKVSRFQIGDYIPSPTFPDLILSIEKLFEGII